MLSATTSASNPNYLWSPGSDTTASITVSPSSTTTYTVTVTDGTTDCANSGSGTVTVLDPPTITSQPASRTNRLGDTATFTVSVAGTPPFSYQWMKGGVSIGGATDATLALTDLSASSTGAYSVVVTNLAGAVTSSNAILAVVVQPVLAILGCSDGEATLYLTGTTGLPYAIQSTTNFVNWVNLQTNLAPYTFVDTNAAGLEDYRFYRAWFVP